VEAVETSDDIVEDERWCPQRQVKRIAVTSVIVLVISLIKGGSHGSRFVSCGSLGFWAVKLSTFPVLGYITWQIAKELVARHQLKEQVGYPYAKCEIKWTRHTASYYPTFCITAGIAAGLLGIGGGMLKGPIMLEMGLPPSVVSATAAYMLFWTTASTTIQFGIMGEMRWDYALLFFVVGGISSLFGQFVLGWAVAKYKKQYLITALITVVIGASTVFMGLSGAARTYQKYSHGQHLGAHSLCDLPVETVVGLAGQAFQPAFK